MKKFVRWFSYKVTDLRTGKCERRWLLRTGPVNWFFTVEE